MTDLEKLQLKQEILTWLKSQGLQIGQLTELSSAIGDDQVIVEHEGKTYRVKIDNIPHLTGVYTDVQARAAMGAKSNSNPYNHDRYTNAEALAYVIDDVGFTTKAYSAAKIGQLLSGYYTTGDIDDLLNTYYTADQIDTLLLNYYTSNQIDTLFTGYYTSGQVDTLLTGYSQTGHTHSESDITDLQSYALANHNHNLNDLTEKSFNSLTDVTIKTTTINTIDYIEPEDNTTGLKTNNGVIFNIVSGVAGVPDATEVGKLRVRDDGGIVYIEIALLANGGGSYEWREIKSFTVNP